MKIFSTAYLKALQLASHRLASVYLCLLSTVESFILPYPPPDIMLAPMALMKPQKAYYFAFLTTVFSVIGGMIGYTLGYYFIDFILPFVVSMGYEAKLEIAKDYFTTYGALIVFIAGFTPIPYKMFTISAGMLAMSFLPFVLASLMGRGLRFFLVVLFIRIFGERFDTFFKKYIDYLGYGVLIAVLVFVIYKNYF